MGSLQAPLAFIFYWKDCIRNQCTECTFGENNKQKHNMKSELNGIIALESRYIHKKWIGLLKRTTETTGPV